MPGVDERIRCDWGNSAPEYVTYHDEEWGTPLHGDDALFERLCLEAFQSGLSWITILRKRPAFRAAFAGFSIDEVAEFGPEDEARLMADAGIVRNRMKIDAAMHNAAKVQEWIMASCRREALTPDGFGAQIYEAADAGEITEEQAGMLVRSFLSAGLDTTVSALGNAVHLLATNPDQWELLRADPSLTRPAFEETIRLETPVQVFSRTATRDTDIGGTAVAKDERVMVFFGAANRDPRRWENPDRFDISRKASGHLAFGLGIHGCVGKPVARIEGEAVLGALARGVGRIESAGEPRRHLNNSIRSFESLPVTFHAP